MIEPNFSKKREVAFVVSGTILHALDGDGFDDSYFESLARSFARIRKQVLILLGSSFCIAKMGT